MLPAARADAYVYWVNYATGTIGRASLDGSDVDQSFVTVAGAIKPLYGIAVDDEHIFWASGAGWIGRADLDGTDVDPTFIPTAAGGGDAEIALGGGKIFWANTTWIGSANVDGTDIDQQALAPQSDYVRGLAVNNGSIFWSDYQNSRIGIGGLSPPSVNPLFISPTAGRPEGLAVDDTHIYWSNGDINTIGRANIDGGGVDQSLIPTSYAYGVEVNDSHIFWANYDTNSIGRATLDGSKVDPSFITGADGPEGVALDAGPDTNVGGSVTAKKTQEQKGKRIVVKVKTKAEEDLEAEASGKVEVAKQAHKLKPQSKSVGGGTEKTLKLKPKKLKGAKKIVEYLKRGKKAQAKLKVKLTDEAGNKKVEKLSVKLKRAG